jgi:hypothetical protein
VIHRVQKQALQIGNFTVNVEGQYLPFAVFQYFVAAEPTFEDEAALRWSVPVSKDILIRLHVPDCNWQMQNRFPFLLGKLGFAFKLSE